MHGILSDFIYCLNSNILSFSEDISISQEFLFLHSFFVRFKFVFRSKEMKTIETIKITMMF